MSMGFERTQVVGNLGADPILLTGQSGTSICAMRVAINRKVKGNAVVKWRDVVCFGALAENMAKILKKGDTVFVDGTPEDEEFLRKDGSKGFAVKILANVVVKTGSPAGASAPTAASAAGGDAAAEALAALRETASVPTDPF
jgi:single-strand DNA-binding protein